LAPFRIEMATRAPARGGSLAHPGYGLDAGG